MDLKSIISSGLLESYVLGTASSEEVERLNVLIAQYPELLTEIETIENALLSAAENAAPALNANVKEELFKKISAEQSNVIDLNPPPQKQIPAFYKYGIAASVALLVGSALINLLLYNRLDHVQQQVAELNQEKNVLANEVQLSSNSLKEAQNSLAIVSDTLVKTIKLKGVGANPASAAFVYWNSRSKEVYLNVMELPVPPKGKQYQLWALADGKPVDAGVFNVVDTLKLQKLKDISSAQAFAVTLEKEGGSPSPTLSEMYLMGTIQ